MHASLCGFFFVAALLVVVLFLCMRLRIRWFVCGSCHSVQVLKFCLMLLFLQELVDAY